RDGVLSSFCLSGSEVSFRYGLHSPTRSYRPSTPSLGPCTYIATLYIIVCFVAALSCLLLALVSNSNPNNNIIDVSFT
ncbi:hypothetical protein IW262DRAFT_1477807, partial [Armillaria fumosa]